MNWFRLIISIVVAQLAGFLGSLFTFTSDGSWYSSIIKPSFNPPNSVFGPVWTTLYLLMGISLYLVWECKKSKYRKVGLYLFFSQLVLNSLWSILFFGLNNPMFAFFEIIVLWFAILFNIIYFYKVKKVASYLLIPYLLWVSFAAVLNYFIMVLN